MVEIQEQILGALMAKPEYIEKIENYLTFTKSKYQTIYDTILDLYDSKQPVNIVTVSNLLNEEGLLDSVGGRFYINDITLSYLNERARDFSELIKDFEAKKQEIKDPETLAILTIAEFVGSLSGRF